MSLFSWFSGGKSKNKQKQKKSSSSGAKSGEPMSRDEIISQAMSSVRSARHEIGEENLNRIVAAIKKKENSTIEVHRRKIAAMDDEKVASGVKSMLRDED